MITGYTKGEPLMDLSSIIKHLAGGGVIVKENMYGPKGYKGAKIEGGKAYYVDIDGNVDELHAAFYDNKVQGVFKGVPLEEPKFVTVKLEELQALQEAVEDLTEKIADMEVRNEPC